MLDPRYNEACLPATRALAFCDEESGKRGIAFESCLCITRYDELYASTYSLTRQGHDNNNWLCQNEESERL